MKSLRLERWGSQILPLSVRPIPRYPYSLRCPSYSIRWQSAAAAPITWEKNEVEPQPPRKRGRPRKVVASETAEDSISTEAPNADTKQQSPLQLTPPSPSVAQALQSAKLAALHARLYLTSSIPIETLARTLIHPTADADPRFNNGNLATLGNDLLGYYTSEHILCHYPRLPMAVIQAVQYAYIGPRALTELAQSWGVEVVAVPGSEVDPGLLQFRKTPLNQVQAAARRRKDPKDLTWKEKAEAKLAEANAQTDEAVESHEHSVSLETATVSFVRALTAAIYLHKGARAAQSWFTSHLIRPRTLDVSKMFTFTQPTRDLSRLCAREGFESPVARLESESGRFSRHPVFVVGVYSGRDKLGEAEGSSLNEARFRAAVRALKGWYLYSPPGEKMVPSAAEGMDDAFAFKPAVIDDGEVIV